MKKVEFELISDADMYLFFKRGMRDRVSYNLRDAVKSFSQQVISNGQILRL